MLFIAMASNTGNMPSMSPFTYQLLSVAQQRIAVALGLSASEARIEAQVLMRVALGNVSRAKLLMVDREPPDAAQATLFASLVQRRLEGEPVAYILGVREFYGLEFKVTPDVLIPRSDTETLVEAALELIAPHQPCRVLDLGTGSGAVAVAIAHHRPLARVTAVDASPAALVVAGENATRFAPGNLHLLHSDWFSAVVDETFDVIASNPPYINADDPHLRQGDLRFEPRGALASGSDGLDDIRRIAADAPRYLVSGGWLLLEHGYDQAGRVADVLRATGFCDVQFRRDIAAIARVTLGRKV